MYAYFQRIREVREKLDATPLIAKKEVTDKTMHDFEELLNQVCPQNEVERGIFDTINFLGSSRQSFYILTQKGGVEYLKLLINGKGVVDSIDIRDKVYVLFDAKSCRYQVSKKMNVNLRTHRIMREVDK